MGKKAAARDDARNALDVLKGMPGAVLSIFTVLQGFVFWVNGVLSVLLGTFLLAPALYVAVTRQLIVEAWLLWVAVALTSIASGLVLIRASRAIRARRPWALALSLVSSLVNTSSAIVFLRIRSAEMGNVDGWVYADIAVFGTASVLAAAGLLLSLAGGATERT